MRSQDLSGSRGGLISKVVSTAKKINFEKATGFSFGKRHFEERFPRFDEYFFFPYVGGPVYILYAQPSVRLTILPYPPGKVFWTEN